MKLILTPLNFCTAFFILLAGYVFIYGGGSVTGGVYAHFTTTIALIFLLFAFVVSFLDIIFRNFFPQTKKLWIVELSFITLTTILFLILKK